jgi:RNA polymerase sigma factor (sigma-70 family)
MVRGSDQRAAALDATWSTLMAAAQGGDRAAYERLLRECTPMIRRVARHQRVHPDLLDDVVQEVLLTIHRARQTYDPARSFSAWLAAIAQRRAIDALRRGGRLGSREVHAPTDYENHPDPSALWHEEGTADMRDLAVRAAVDQLPAGQREAIETLALQQLSLDEAARSTGKTKGALKVSMHRALQTLRERFGGDAG